MTFEEASALAKKLGEINESLLWASSPAAKKALRKQFKAVNAQIVYGGYKARGMIIAGKPMFTVAKSKNNQYMAYDNNRPEDKQDNTKDCTTRCISYCTDVDYNTIFAEQLANAAKAGNPYGKNSYKFMSIWAKSLTSRGFVRLDLVRKMSRKRLLVIFAKAKIDHGIIAARSRSHVAAMDLARQKILDTFDSAGGQVTTIFVKEEDASKFNSLGLFVMPSLYLARERSTSF